MSLFGVPKNGGVGWKNHQLKDFTTFMRCVGFPLEGKSDLDGIGAPSAGITTYGSPQYGSPG